MTSESPFHIEPAPFEACHATVKVMDAGLLFGSPFYDGEGNQIPSTPELEAKYRTEYKKASQEYFLRLSMALVMEGALRMQAIESHHFPKGDERAMMEAMAEVLKVGSDSILHQLTRLPVPGFVAVEEPSL